MQREQLIDNWLNQVMPQQDFKINYLAGDASFRRYARITLSSQRYMLMDAPPEKEDCAPFVQIASYLSSHGARVPQIVAQDLTQGFLLLEDFGDQLLSTELNQSTVDQYYLQAFAQIIQLQSIAVDAQIFPYYSAEKLTDEMRLFDHWMLPALDITLSEAQQSMLNNSYAWILDNLKNQPQVIVHRDYHSRNLMVLEGESVLGVIDFQDAVVGPDTYDLISIVRDAYVQWLPEQVEKWIDQFYGLLPESAKIRRSLEQFRLDAEVMSIQRHLKILGIFVRLFVRDGKSGYLKDLPRVMWYLRQELKNCPELAELQSFVENDVIPKFEQKYGTYQEVTIEMLKEEGSQ
ncbi:MAG: phosphotransferase [Pseudomonadota bacterium]|nr:phosphotransferase [Pseudomonadota bacterium]